MRPGWEITKCFCPPCTFFHFFGSCSGLTAQTFPAGKIVDIHNVKPRQPGERSVSCKFESHQHNKTKSRETDDPSVKRPPTFNFPLDHKCEQNIFQLAVTAYAFLYFDMWHLSINIYEIYSIWTGLRWIGRVKCFCFCFILEINLNVYLTGKTTLINYYYLIIKLTKTTCCSQKQQLSMFYY